MKIANFIEKWLNTFGKELLQEYKDYNYLWEVFFLKSKNKFLCGVEATKEFSKVDRKNAISIEMMFEEETNEYDENFIYDWWHYGSWKNNCVSTAQTGFTE